MRPLFSPNAQYRQFLNTMHPLSKVTLGLIKNYSISIQLLSNIQKENFYFSTQLQVFQFKLSIFPALSFIMFSAILLKSGK